MQKTKKQDKLLHSIPLGKTLSVWNETGKRGIISMTDTENDFLYAGEQYNAGTGLYYLRARYIASSTGTFISMDSYQGSIYDPVSLHKYLYANANPVMYTDPSGYSADTTLFGVNVKMAASNILSASLNLAFKTLKGAFLEQLFQLSILN